MKVAKTFTNVHLESLLAHYTARGWQDCERGLETALTAYIKTNVLGMDTLVVRDMPYPDDAPLFLECLAEAGISEFLLCDLQRGLIEFLHVLLPNGWQVCEPYENNDPALLGLRVRKGKTT